MINSLPVSNSYLNYDFTKKPPIRELNSAKLEKVKRIAEIIFLTMGSATLTASFALSAMTITILPVLWPVAFSVFLVSATLFAALACVKLIRPNTKQRNAKPPKHTHSIEDQLDLAISQKTLEKSAAQKEADKKALQRILDVYSLDRPRNFTRFVDPNQVQFTYSTAKENAEKPYGIIRKAPKIKIIIFKGGGSKGAVYPTFMEALNKKTNLLSEAEDLAGTSAGAMFASLLAAGVPLKKIKKIVNSTTISEQLKSSNDPSFNASIKLKKKKGFFPASKLAKTIHSHIYLSVMKYYEKLNEEQKKEMRETLGEHEFEKMKKVVTFKHLALLHQLNPKKFKKLHVVGYNNTQKKVMYYNAANTPDMPCYEAVRISMSIPKVMMPVIDNNGHELVDGGMGSNAPVEIFSAKEDFDPSETLLLTFSKNGSGYKTLHTPHRNKKSSSILAWLEEQVFGPHFIKNKAKDKQKAYSLGVNTLVIPHGKLQTLSFWPSQESLSFAKKQAHKAGQKYGGWLSNQAIHRSYASIEEAASSLSHLEKLYVLTSKKYKDSTGSQGKSAAKGQFNSKELEFFSLI